MAKEKKFLSDIETIRKRAREHIREGAVTSGYSADRKTVVKLLNEALATEIVCVLRYKAHHYLASGINAKSVAAEFLEHANEEQEHADWLAERITQLNGKPQLDPSQFAKNSHTLYIESEDLTGMLTEDLVAERIAIETYTAILHWLGEDDPTSSRLIRKILEKEEEHAEDIATLMERVK